MDLSFGTRLRLQRERRQIGLAAIAAETKIKLSLLEGLERDDVSHWPEGIFRRAYLRVYARSIGMDPDQIVREFLELHPDAVEMPPPGSAAWPDRDGEAANPQAPTRLRRLVTSAIGAVSTLLQRGEKSDPVLPNQSAVARDSSLEAETRRPEAPRATNARHSSIEDGAGLPKVSLTTAASLCTRLAQVQNLGDAARVLEEAAGMLGAMGLIVWSWDSLAAALRPSLAYGYPDAVLAPLSAVRMDAENAVAAAFRSGEIRVVNGGNGVTGAVAVPLIAPNGCVGVLALEFHHGRERRHAVRAFATIIAAQLVGLVGSAEVYAVSRLRAAGAGA